MGRWEGLKSANELRRIHPWAVAGTFLGGIGAISGAVIAALSLFVNDGSSGPVVPDPITTTTKRKLVTPPAYTYHLVNDNTKALSVSIPKQWRTVFGDGWHLRGLAGIEDGTLVGPGVNAAPSISRWRSDYRTPGFFVGASKQVARVATPRKLLTSLTLPCDPGPIRPIATDAKSGGSVRWTCPGTSARWYVSAWWPPRTHAYVVYVQVKLVTSSDDEALQQILETLTVRPARIK